MDSSKISILKSRTTRRLIKGLLFILIFLIINTLISDYFLGKVLSKSRTGLIDRQFQENEKYISILALGDSHVATGFDPRVFTPKKAFNFALYGENYIYNFYKLKYILKRNLPVKVIILPVDLHSFSSWRANRFLFDFYWVKYLDYWEIGVNRGEIFSFVSKFIQGKYLPYLGEFEAMFNLKRQKLRKNQVVRPEIFQGFVLKTDIFAKNRIKRARQRVRLHFGKHRYFDEMLAIYFKKILELCREQNKPLVLVRFPVSKIYYQLVAKKVPVEEIYQKIQTMVKPYPNVHLLDYLDYFFADDISCLDDPDHLNQQGAKLFSKEIRRRLGSLNLLDK